MGEIFKRELPNATLPFTGERFTDGHDIETEIEHYHRYFFARSYCRGKDVLDIASGEGYGSALLAQVASSVIGVDICDEAVSHAQNTHTRSNLSYLTGDVRNIPIEDHSVDVVISFETLEHFYEHDLFMQEVKRVLRPGGYLIISTPNSDIYSGIGVPANPYHVNELTKTEFIFLCKKYFKYMSTVNQRALVGSVLISDSDDTTGLPILFESRDKEYVERSNGLSRAFYLISILSDENEITARNSIYINENIRDLLNSKLQFSQQILEEKNRHIVNLENALHENSEYIKNLENDVLNKSNHIVNIENIVLEHGKHIENLENDVLNKNNHIKQIDNVLLEKNKHVDNLESDVLNKSKHIENIENIFLENSKHIENLENDVLNKKKHIEQIENILLENGKYIGDLENDVFNKKKHIEQIENILLENGKYIGNLENDVLNKKNHIENVENKFFERDKDVQLLRREVEYFKHQFPGVLITWIRKIILNKKAIKVCSESIFFDANWYLIQYPDVKETEVNPVVHYVKLGASEYRDPGPNF